MNYGAYLIPLLSFFNNFFKSFYRVLLVFSLKGPVKGVCVVSLSQGSIPLTCLDKTLLCTDPLCSCDFWGKKYVYFDFIYNISHFVASFFFFAFPTREYMK